MEQVPFFWQERKSEQIQECELPRVLNLERESSEHLRWIHLEQVETL